MSAENFYSACSSAFSNAMHFCQLAISLASTSGNTKRHSQALYRLAQIHLQLGNYLAAILHAHEAQKLARISADLYGEACALYQEACAWTSLGNYKESISVCCQARELLVLCGMSGSTIDQYIVALQAQIHLAKSEYSEAHNIHTQSLQDCPLHMDPYNHALALLNLGEIGYKFILLLVENFQKNSYFYLNLDIPAEDINKKILILVILMGFIAQQFLETTLSSVLFHRKKFQKNLASHLSKQYLFGQQKEDSEMRRGNSVNIVSSMVQGVRNYANSVFIDY